MKNLKENYTIYASFQISLRIKITILVKLLAYQNHLMVGLSTWRSRYESDEDEPKIYKVERSCLLTKQSYWKKIRQCLDIDSGQQKRKSDYSWKSRNKICLFFWLKLARLILQTYSVRYPFWVPYLDLFLVFSDSKNLQFASCLGKGPIILLKYTALFIQRAFPAFPKHALSRMAVAEPHFKETFRRR